MRLRAIGRWLNLALNHQFTTKQVAWGMLGFTIFLAICALAYQGVLPALTVLITGYPLLFFVGWIWSRVWNWAIR